MTGGLLPVSTAGCQVSTVTLDTAAPTPAAMGEASTLTYRHLSYDQSGDKPVQDLSLSGPELGLIFRF